MEFTTHLSSRISVTNMAASKQTVQAPFHHTFTLWHKLPNELKCRILLLLLLSTDYQRSRYICQVGRYENLLHALTGWTTPMTAYPDVLHALENIKIEDPTVQPHPLVPLTKRCTQVSKEFSGLFEFALRQYLRSAKQDTVPAIECTHRKKTSFDYAAWAAGQIAYDEWDPDDTLCALCKAHKDYLKPERDASDVRAEVGEIAERILRLMTERNKGTVDDEYKADCLPYEEDGTLAALGSARWKLRRVGYSDEEVIMFVNMAKALECSVKNVLEKVKEMAASGWEVIEALQEMEVYGLDAGQNSIDEKALGTDQGDDGYTEDVKDQC